MYTWHAFFSRNDPGLWADEILGVVSGWLVHRRSYLLLLVLHAPVFFDQNIWLGLRSTRRGNWTLYLGVTVGLESAGWAESVVSLKCLWLWLLGTVPLIRNGCEILLGHEGYYVALMVWYVMRVLYRISLDSGKNHRWCVLVRSMLIVAGLFLLFHTNRLLLGRSTRFQFRIPLLVFLKVDFRFVCAVRVH